MLNNNISLGNKIQQNSPLIGIIALFTLFICLNLPVMTTLWRHSFDDGTYSHAYLIPFITLYLYHQLQHDKLLVYRTDLSPIGVILFLISCYGLFVSSSAQVSVGYWLASLTIITSAIIILFQYHWRMIFPALFLILIIPVWGPLATILQGLSVKGVSLLMSFTGIPTYIEGNFVTIPAGVFEIAGGCSGLRYFIVAIAISSLFVFLNMRNFRNIFIFISLAIIGALITNWIRITLLIVIGQYTDMTSSLMTDHNSFGWYIFIPFMILLFALGNRLAEKLPTGDENLTNKASVASSIKKPSLIFIVIGLLLSSTTISYQSNADQSLIIKSLEAYKKQRELEPFIQYFSHANNSNLYIKNTNITTRTFDFSGSDLDEKPTFYNNRLAPDNWKRINTYQQKQWNILELTYKKQKSLIATSFQLKDQLYASRNKFKVARIKAGLLGEKNTKLHWLSINCQTDCEQEKTILEQTINNFIVIN